MIDHNSIFSISNPNEFENLALQIFNHQYRHNAIYRSFCDLINCSDSDVHTVSQIPCLPIQFFKSHTVVSSKDHVEAVFTSSATSSKAVSRHYVTDLSVYTKSFRKGFDHFYGNSEAFAILALLPSYLEREGSSLIFMVDDLIKSSTHNESGFYLNNFNDLYDQLLKLEAQKKPTILIGVSFALLDFVKEYTLNLNHTIVMETGGMKGRRKEMVREELHQFLKSGFGVNTIHSEFGMTELLSQAYSLGDSKFKSPPWMQAYCRDTEDALTILPNERTGGLNIIDLANYNSCSFIATQDLGRTNSDGTFEVLGRFDNSDIRGCNLMAL